MTQTPTSPAVRAQRDALTRAEFLRSIATVDALLVRAEAAVPQVAATWRGRLAELRGRLDDGETRVAVVGAVKSGKSTLINALTGTDLLPRGAGVLTAQITELRRGDHLGISVQWATAEDIDAEFSHLLGRLGLPGQWHLADTEHRATAREAAQRAGTSAPATEALAPLLRGYGEARERLGRSETDLPLPPDGLAPWATRDETTAFLSGLRVTIPSPQLPAGLTLVDCQGYDAWNPTHAADLLAALQDAHALVYVVSSRVGFRDADQRLLEQLRALGLLRVCRFVLNVDWGELRRPEELQRVREAVATRVTDLGGGELYECSALQALLEHLSLVDPEAVTPGERRLLDAWDAGSGPGMAVSRETFRTFRALLWSAAEEEREHTQLQRLRAELRTVLVGAADALRRHGVGADGLRRVAWQDEAADRVLHWAQQHLDRTVTELRGQLTDQVQQRFRGRRAPQRQLWQGGVTAALASPSATGDPLTGILTELGRSEPVRINQVRNLALDLRGKLARHGEEMARSMAGRLSEAGLPPATPPTRAELSRKITATRRIPLFTQAAAAALREPADAGDTGGPWASLRRLATHLRPPAASRSGAARLRQDAAVALLRVRLRSAWAHYLDQVLDHCLLPHAEEAAAQIYACLAEGVLHRLQNAVDAIETETH